MSFSDETREEICKMRPKFDCCRMSMLYGMYFGGFRSDGSKEVKDYALLCAAKLEKASHGTDLYTVASSPLIQPVMECAACRWNFVKGVFAICGTVTNPENSYHLEFSLEGRERAEDFAKYLTVLGYSAGITERHGNVFGVYVKDSEHIVDILGHMEASRAAFRLLDTKMMGEIRNEANRVSNCETANIKRTVDAASEQMRAIEKIMEQGRQDSLPTALKDTFDLRAAYPDATLSELAEMHNPPITRSGVNHRLQRIIEFSKK